MTMTELIKQVMKREITAFGRFLLSFVMVAGTAVMSHHLIFVALSHLFLWSGITESHFVSLVAAISLVIIPILSALAGCWYAYRVLEAADRWRKDPP